MVQPYDGEQHQVVLTDRRTLLIERQTSTLTATIMMPWALALVAIQFALAVMPEEDDLLVLGSKPLHENQHRRDEVA